MARYLTEFVGTFLLVLIIGLSVHADAALAPLSIGLGLFGDRSHLVEARQRQGAPQQGFTDPVHRGVGDLYLLGRDVRVTQGAERLQVGVRDVTTVFYPRVVERAERNRSR